MKKQRRVKLPLEPLPDLLAWWKECRVRGMIIGGLAVSLRGRPRTTRDVDAVVLVPESSWADFLKKGKAHHFAPRIPRALAFARKARVLVLRHGPSRVQVDLSLGDLQFEREAIDRATQVTIGKMQHRTKKRRK